MEVSLCKPNLGEGELLVRNEFEALFVDLSYALHVTGIDFLECGVEEPDVDVAMPITFLLARWDLCNRPLVYLADTLDVSGNFFELGEVEPCIVVLGIVLKHLFVHHAALLQHDMFDTGSITVLLLKF